MKSKSMSIRGNVLIVATLVAISALLCTTAVDPSDSAGNISVVDNKICGTIYDEGGKPAAGAYVVLRPADYLADVGKLAKQASGQHTVTYSTMTEADGRFVFTRNDSITAAEYALEAVSSDRKTMLFVDSINIDSALLTSNTWLDIDTPTYATTLLKPCTIKGTIRKSDGAVEGSVQVYGLNVNVPINSDGTYEIDSIPAGTLRLQVSVKENDSLQRGVLTVKAQPGSIATVEPIANVSLDFKTVTNATLTDNSWHTAGDTVIIPIKHEAYTQAGYVFTGWNSKADGSGEAFAPGDTLIVDTNEVQLFAQWKETLYKLTVTANGKGSVSGTDSLKIGDSARVIALPEPGYQLHYWRVVEGEANIADSSADTARVIMIKGDAVVEAVFGAITFRTKLVEEGWQESGYSRFLDQTDDGGYIRIFIVRPVSGTEYNPVIDYRIRMVKINLYGKLEWSKDLYGDKKLSIITVKKTNNNYMIMSTLSSAFDSTSNLLLVVDSSGTTILSKRYSAAELDGSLCDFDITSDNVIIVGMNRYNGNVHSEAIVGINSIGDILWTDSIVKEEVIEHVYSKADGTVLAFKQNWDNDSLIVDNINSKGELLWERVIQNQIINASFCFTKEKDGTFYNIIQSGDNDSSGTYVGLIGIAKISDGAELIWSKTFVQQSVATTPICLAGKTDYDEYVFWQHNNSNNGDQKTLQITKFSESGTPLSETIMRDKYDHTFSIVQLTPDKGYVIYETLNLDGDKLISYLIKTNANGEIFR